MAEWSIYALCAPHTGNVRYVGFTNDVRKRIGKHVAAARRGSPYPVHCWIKALLDKKLLPGVLILEQGTGEWEEREKFWIAFYRCQPTKLLNVLDGGNLPKVVPEKRNKTFSAEHRRKISEAKRGCKRPDAVATCHQMAERNRGKKLNISEEERERRRALGRKLIVEMRKNLRNDPSFVQANKKRLAERTRGVWAERTPEERKMIVAKMIKTKRTRNEERRNTATRQGC